MEVSVSDAKLYDANGGEITSASGTANMKFTANVTSRCDIPVDVYTALYDGENLVIVNKQQIEANTINTPIDVQFNNKALANGHIKVFTWDSTKELTPVHTPFEQFTN